MAWEGEEGVQGKGSSLSIRSTRLKWDAATYHERGRAASRSGTGERKNEPA